MENARRIYTKAREASLKTIDDNAIVWCDSVEFELQEENFDDALALVRQGTLKYMKSNRLWSLRLDLEESLGDVASTKAAYDLTFEYNVTTPVWVLQYTSYLQQHDYFEDAFQVFERALKLFPTFPHAHDIWVAYLESFVNRYQGLIYLSILKHKLCASESGCFSISACLLQLIFSLLNKVRLDGNRHSSDQFFQYLCGSSIVLLERTSRVL
jgi:hypothetical protein